METQRGVYMRAKEHTLLPGRLVQVGALVTFLALLCVVAVLTGRSTASMKVINLAPHAQWFAVARPTFGGQWQTAGWHYLSAGQTQLIAGTFWWVEPTFYVAARTADSEVIHYLYGGEELAFEGVGPNLSRMVIDGEMFFETDSIGRLDKEGEYPAGAYDLEFSQAVIGNCDRNFTFTIVDSSFPHLSLTPKSAPSKLLIASREADRLGESLQRQARFARTWQGKVFPFHLGAVLADPNGLEHLGVEITVTTPTTRDGYPMRLLPGDTLVEFAGRPVYSPLDVFSLLYEHATDIERGVDKAIAFAVLRAGFTEEDITGYFFNRDFWERKNGDAVMAAWLGLSDGVTFSHGAAANAVLIKGAAGLSNALNWVASKLDDKYKPKYVKTPSFKQLRWTIRQNQARLKQFEEAAYDLGAFTSFFIQPTRGVARHLLGRPGKVLTQSFAGQVALEVLESTAWTLADGSPMRTTSDLKEELRAVVPLAAAGGALQGSLRLVRR